MPEERHPDSPELEHYVSVLRRRWRLLLIGIVVPAAAALVYLALAPRVYEATATLMAVHPAAGDMPSRPESTATTRGLFESHAMAAALLQEFQLHQAPASLTPSTFLRDVLRVDEVRGTSLLRVSVRLPDPELAARLANRVSEAAIERSGRVAQAEETAERAFLKAQLDEAHTNLQAVQQKLLAYKREAHLDLLQQERMTLLAQRAELPRLLVEIAGERAKLSSAEEELDRLENAGLPARAGRPDGRPRLSLHAGTRAENSGGIPPDAGDMPDDGEQRATHRDSDALAAGLALRDVLHYQVALSRSRLAGLEAQRRQLLNRMKPDSPVQQQLNELYDREMGMARLEIEHDVLKAIYADLARRYQQTRLETIARATELQVIEPAVPSGRPVFPRPERILAVALLGGLIVSLVGVFAVDVVRQGDRPATRTGVAAPRETLRPHEDASLSVDRNRLLKPERRNGV